MDEKTAFAGNPLGPVLDLGASPSAAQHPMSPSTAPTLTPSVDSNESQHDAGEKGGVDVAQAKKEFNDLSRQLSRQSSLHRVATGQKDPEKEGEDKDDFDLLSYMKGDKGARDEAGFHAKQVSTCSFSMTSSPFRPSSHFPAI